MQLQVPHQSWRGVVPGIRRGVLRLQQVDCFRYGLACELLFFERGSSLFVASSSAQMAGLDAECYGVAFALHRAKLKNGYFDDLTIRTLYFLGRNIINLIRDAMSIL